VPDYFAASHLVDSYRLSFTSLIPQLSSGYDPQSMAQTFFKVLAPQEALKILSDLKAGKK